MNVITNNTYIMDCHQHMLDDFIFAFLEHEKEVVKGTFSAFDTVYAPILKEEGVNFVNLVVGGDHVVQVLYSASNLRFWDAHKKIDALLTEVESGCSSFVICRNSEDIDRVVDEGLIGLFLSLEGGIPLQGKPNLNLLSSLRSLYRMGLRSLQLTGNGRNRLGDGAAQERTQGRLTTFGRQVVEEADRLGILLDTAQLSDNGFYHLMELTNRPVVDSHCGCLAISDFPGNISDERISRIASSGGVVGISFRAANIAMQKDQSAAEDLVKQINHAVSIAGVDHVGLGPDFSAFLTPVDRVRERGYSNLGPEDTQFNRLTPVQSEKFPGWVDGVWNGVRKSDFVDGYGAHGDFPGIAGLLLTNGYNFEQIGKILGGNMIRVYRDSL